MVNIFKVSTKGSEICEFRGVSFFFEDQFSLVHLTDIRYVRMSIKCSVKARLNKAVKPVMFYLHCLHGPHSSLYHYVKFLLV
jgi:hypothetical protein